MKALKVLLAALMVCGLAACSSNEAAPAETAEEEVTEEVAEETEETTEEAEEEATAATYVFINQTGEKLTALTLTDKGSEEVVYELDAEKGLKSGKAVKVEVELPADAQKDAEYNLTFTTEGGYTGEFDTLHYETVTINLLAEDAMTGATAIAFGDEDMTANYSFINKTGEVVTEVTLTDKEDDTVVFELDTPLEVDAEAGYEFTLPSGQALLKEYNLTFTTEGGYTAEFDTLHFEEVKINLIAEDAKTGATAIEFAH